MSAPKKPRLGRGLEALLGEDYLAPPAAGSTIGELDVRSIVPNPFQPRREFDADELADLRRSIAENGLLQPIVVRPVASVDGERYELVAGERRFRAVTELGWKEIPAVVREVDDRALLVLALVENIQREALNPLEEAEGFRFLAEDFGLTQAQIAEAVGKDRSTVANALRLLKLPLSMRRLLEEGALSMGHARALLGVEDPGRLLELGRRAVEEGWSVREIEARVRDDSERKEKGRSAGALAGGKPVDPVLAALQAALGASLGTRVKVRRRSNGAGTMEIAFQTDDDFERIFEVVTGRDPAEVTG